MRSKNFGMIWIEKNYSHTPRKVSKDLITNLNSAGGMIMEKGIER